MNIRENMGTVDRLIRVGAAIFFVVAFFLGIISGALAYLSLILALEFLATAMFGVSPFYRIIGLNTRMKHRAHH